MGFEVRLTDIRGEPPLQVGEFLLDKDNNVLYVGSKQFDLNKNGGAEISVIGRFIPIPPKRAIIGIQDRSNVNISVVARTIPIPTYKATIGIQDKSNIGISVNGKFTELNKYSASVNIEDRSNIKLKGSGNIVT